MNFEDVKNTVNEWIWDKDEGTYFWILNADEKTKTLIVRGLNGLETTLIFSPERFFKNAKKINL